MHLRRLFWSISSHFIPIYYWNMRCSQNLQKIHQNLSFGDSRSSMFTNIYKALSPMLVMVCSEFVPTCNRFHTIRPNRGKITSFWGVPLFEAMSVVIYGTSAVRTVVAFLFLVGTNWNLFCDFKLLTHTKKHSLLLLLCKSSQYLTVTLS